MVSKTKFFIVASYKEGTKLLGANKKEAALIQQFIALADNELIPAQATWIFPILGWIPANEAVRAPFLSC